MGGCRRAIDSAVPRPTLRTPPATIGLVLWGVEVGVMIVEGMVGVLGVAKVCAPPVPPLTRVVREELIDSSTDADCGCRWGWDFRNDDDDEDEEDDDDDDDGNADA